MDTSATPLSTRRRACRSRSRRRPRKLPGFRSRVGPNSYLISSIHVERSVKPCVVIDAGIAGAVALVRFVNIQVVPQDVVIGLVQFRAARLALAARALGRRG